MWTQGYLFYTLGFKPILLYSVALTVPVRPLGTLLAGSWALFKMALSLWFLFWFGFGGHFIISGTKDTASVSSMFLTPLLHSLISLSLVIDSGIRDQDLGTRCAHCSGMSLPPDVLR